MSKGNTQANAMETDHFDAVAFKGSRTRLLQALQAVGLLPDEDQTAFERRFTATERDFAFASVVRCSLTGMNKKKGQHTAESPCVVPAFQPASEGVEFVENCVDQHLAHLSPRTRRVLLLGNTDSYIAALRKLIGRLRGPVTEVNDVAYVSGDVLFVHLAHPSPGNGHFNEFIEGRKTSGVKRDLAREALAARSC